MPNPDPGKRPERDLQSAGPVDAAHETIGREPALELLHDLVEILALATQKERLRQQHEMLMAIQLPDVLVVADRIEIEIRHAAHVAERGRFAVRIILAP